MLYIKLMLVNLETWKKTLIFVQHVDYSDRVQEFQTGMLLICFKNLIVLFYHNFIFPTICIVIVVIVLKLKQAPIF